MTTTLPPLLNDQLPHNLVTKRRILARLRDELDRFGYLAISTPLVEHADLFLIKAGDAAINRLVSFDLMGHTLCIRPEFTAPVARVYNDHFRHRKDAIRLQMSGPILQYESLKHGEITQQDAIGAELINEDGALADAELIALASSMLEQAQLPWTVTIGHSGLIDRFIDRYELNREMRRFVLTWLPRLRDGVATLQDASHHLGLEGASSQDTPPSAIEDSDSTELALQALMMATPQRGPNGGRSREEIARRLLEKHQRTDQRKHAIRALQDLVEILQQADSPTTLLAYLQSDPLEPVAARIVETFKLLEAYSVPMERINFDLSFTRNLDYYTGVVFEFRAETPEAEILLGGGGRYNELIGLLGGVEHIPAVGFMLYVDNIIQALSRDNAAPAQEPVVLIVSEYPGKLTGAIQLASQLRQRKASVIVSNGKPQELSPQVTHVLSLAQDNQVTLHTLATDSVHKFASSDTETLITIVEKSS